MLMKWEDLEIGDKLTFNQNYIADILRRRYYYNSREIGEIARNQNEILEIDEVEIRQRIIISGFGIEEIDLEVLHICFKNFYFTYRISSNGKDAGYGKNCPHICGNSRLFPAPAGGGRRDQGHLALPSHGGRGGR